jgi:2-hydroxychromene-2-carboxylate isomerase
LAAPGGGCGSCVPAFFEHRLLPQPSFYFDFNSPYAYLAAERIDELIPEAEWKLIAFAIVLAKNGTLEERLTKLDPAPIVAEVSARAAERGLPPFAPPPEWPVDSWSLMPLRAGVFAAEQGRMREFCHAAFHQSFVHSRSLADLDNVVAAAAAAELDPDEVREAIGSERIKDRLKEQTDEAMARGVTGIPTVAIGDDLFWGDDRLDDAAAAR